MCYEFMGLKDKRKKESANNRGLSGIMKSVMQGASAGPVGLVAQPAPHSSCEQLTTPTTKNINPTHTNTRYVQSNETSLF